jgi:hypothetical protein
MYFYLLMGGKKMEADLSKVDAEIIEFITNWSQDSRRCPIRRRSRGEDKCAPCRDAFSSFIVVEGNSICPCKALDPEYVTSIVNAVITQWEADGCAEGTYILEDPE